DRAEYEILPPALPLAARGAEKGGDLLDRIADLRSPRRLPAVVGVQHVGLRQRRRLDGRPGSLHPLPLAARGAEEGEDTVGGLEVQVAHPISLRLPPLASPRLLGCRSLNRPSGHTPRRP